MVDDTPFFYIGTQLSPHRLLHFGWSWVDIEKLFKTASENHFTVLAVPVQWNWIEKEQNKYDWAILDQIIEYAIKYSIRLELLWFGSNVCGKSIVAEGCPAWALEQFEKVRGKKGELYYVDDFCYVSYENTRFYKLDICDPYLLKSEQLAILKTFNHIREYLDMKQYPNIIIGVQVLNEPTAIKLFDSTNVNIPDLDRSYSKYANKIWEENGYTDALIYNVDMLWHYINSLSESVKTSNYSVWTRVNLQKNYEGVEFNRRFVIKNETMRNQKMTNIDFIGDDPYTNDIKNTYDYGCNGIYNYGENLPMIMENGGEYENTDKLIFSALAGGAYYNIWELITSGETKWQTGFYYVNHSQKILHAKWHQTRIKNLIYMLRKDAFDLATLLSGSKLIFFNHLFNYIYNQSNMLDGRKINYSTSFGGAGVAIARKDCIIFMSTAKANFSVFNCSTLDSIEEGFFDENNDWKKNDSIAYDMKISNLSFMINAYQCIRIESVYLV